MIKDNLVQIDFPENAPFSYRISRAYKSSAFALLLPFRNKPDACFPSLYLYDRYTDV